MQRRDERMKLPARSRRVWGVILVVVMGGCAGVQGRVRGSKASPKVEKVPLPPVEPVRWPADPPLALEPGARLFVDARVMTAAGQIFDPGYVLVRNGRIAEVGPGRPANAPAKAEVVALPGKVITPGIIDVHSHLGVYPSPGVEANADGNEMVSPATPQVWAEHGFWPQDPDLERALAGGVTTVQVLPGSANLIGGRSFVLRLAPGATSARAMRFPGAKQGLKMACGENPKRTYGSRGGPQTRMGNTARFRVLFQRALEYRRKVRRYERDLAAWKASRVAATARGGPAAKGEKDPPVPPPRDLGLETLVRVLDGEMLVHVHCYRADEMEKMLDLAHTFGFRIRAFHHALEAYKIRRRLAEEGVAVASWADWWGYKMEAFDGIPYNLALLQAAGVRAIVHSDSSSDVRRLNQEAAKAAAAGRALGLDLSPDTVLRWLTANPAWALGLEEVVGTLEPGKLADLVVWSGDPFSVYTLAERVYLGGRLVYDRAHPGPPASDFELGIRPSAGEVQP